MKMKEHILIAGAGEAGRMLLEEFARRGRQDEVAGFVDDDPSKAAGLPHGSELLGGTFDIPRIVREMSVNRVIIAMPSAPHETVSRIVSGIISGHLEIHVHILPPGEKYFDTVPLIPSLQDVTVSDLLERDEYSVDIDTIRERFSGKTVLITGAGGSIGSELCRQLLKFDVARIVALGRGEHSIYTLIKTMNEYMDFMSAKPEMIYRIVDVKDMELLERTFGQFRPDIVFHAAAHKHVPLMEYNELEAVQNNVAGTRNVLEAALRNGSAHFILVSTDKAVRPVNVMGATKRLAEMVTGYYHREKGLNTAIVRFGNVIGSRGSVIPLFREQIEKGGPVTVTHPEVTRYFMSIPEAALLVINAAALSGGGEIFVLNMGKQYRLDTIARRLIEMYGLEPDRDIRVVYSGLRPGEKLYEEIFHHTEGLEQTANNKILVMKKGNDFSVERIGNFLDEDIPGLSRLSSGRVRDLLGELVADYKGSGAPSGEERAGKYIS